MVFPERRIADEKERIASMVRKMSMGKLLFPEVVK